MNITTIKYIVVFLIFNFAALGLGSIATSEAVSGIWYQSLNKAPWTPPGWAFGAAWSTIMICYAVFMGFAWKVVSERKTLAILFALQWVLNVSWNPAFFVYQLVALGLVIITSLTVLVAYFLVKYKPIMRYNSVLILPYLLWLFIACSLNLYVLIYN